MLGLVTPGALRAAVARSKRRKQWQRHAPVSDRHLGPSALEMLLRLLGAGSDPGGSARRV